METERLSKPQFDRFCNFIYTKCGIRIDERKVLLLTNRIRRRLRAGGFDSFDVYYQFLTSPAGAGELENFLDAITTHETFFFRTEKHFDWLKDDLIAELVAQHRTGDRPAKLRILSAGCATGAEPYSIAICLEENMYRLQNWSLQILGTDISEEALRMARAGAFKSRAIEQVPQRQRQRYFQHRQDDDIWEVRPSLKRFVTFRKHNLIKPLRETAFDCIFIRNVLIYFDRASKRQVIDNLLRVLTVGGYLVVGPSEGIYDMLEPLRKISPLLYQKVDDLRPRDAVGIGGDAQR